MIIRDERELSDYYLYQGQPCTYSFSYIPHISKELNDCTYVCHQISSLRPNTVLGHLQHLDHGLATDFGNQNTNIIMQISEFSWFSYKWWSLRAGVASGNAFHSLSVASRNSPLKWIANMRTKYYRTVRQCYCFYLLWQYYYYWFAHLQQKCLFL